RSNGTADALHGKISRGGCRRRARHYRSRFDISRWRVGLREDAPAKPGALGRRDGAAHICLGAAQYSRRHAHSCAVDGMSVSKGGSGDSRNGPGVARVDIVYLADVGGIEHGAVADHRVGYVDVGDIGSACSPPGIERLAKTQWAPAHVRAPEAAEAKAPMPPSDPGHQSGGVNRSHENWAGTPTPPVAPKYPAAVMERSKAPGLVIHPTPAPRGNPNPMAVAIRRPADRNGIRIPQIAVFGRILPRSVVVQILVTNHIT